MLLVATTALLVATVSAGNDTVFSAYFADWARYRKGVYKHEAKDVKPIAGRIDHLMLSFAYFCPPAGTYPMPYWATPPFGTCTNETEYELVNVEQSDPEAAKTFNEFKQTVNPKLKLLVSIGGWNFPSQYFSQMVRTKKSRMKFIRSIGSWMERSGYDGVDLDWEFPCSPERENRIKITCDTQRTVEDKGGNCPADKFNLPLLLQEMRFAFPDKMITLATQAEKHNWVHMDLPKISQWADYLHVMSYDYTISNAPSAQFTGPNAPLFNPPASPGVPEFSIDYTVRGYLAAGVPKEKIILGVPFYGHTWYTPNESSWQRFGVEATQQEACCKDAGKTYGAKYGRGSETCGTLMYSEIIGSNPVQYYDDTTESDIGYWDKDATDALSGTWVSYNGKRSIQRITKYVLDMKLAGLFVFDTSMDTMNPNTGEWTYELINSIAAQIGGHGPCHAISSSVTADWCNMNCHHQPEICPIDLCACSDIAPPAGSCHSISGSVTDAWCQENCHHVPKECPSNLCKCINGTTFT